jgi:hypothetical protein
MDVMRKPRGPRGLFEEDRAAVQELVREPAEIRRAVEDPQGHEAL